MSIPPHSPPAVPEGPLDDLEVVEPPAPARRSRRDEGAYDDDDLDPQRQGGRSRCPYCRSAFPPLMRKKISPAGWVVFAAVLAMALGMCVVGICFWPLLVVAFICLPLSVLGILITTEERVCGECGAKLGR